ncbi:hypothetical protein P2G88_16325 [Aliiglaciecola sp. CAU 1673]|uniref:substrate-binding periplasmic protein n=1 Tax=Aliiglaciecola sp. CAU 1673 TaxID=3032595 RepID=UPI0023DB284E|nr:hypothetical protein [Aliiglaciecola sp. CAU 1673]MDF2179819.1 hypothetical protein [Aliiglaciecola sp. CAU 1673]
MNQTIVALMMFLFSWQLSAKELVIAVERIDYFPHYDFTDHSNPTYASELLAMFAEAYGHRLVFLPFPIKRAKRELLQNPEVDFLFPDNPAWADFQEDGQERHFSAPLVHILGGTMVRPERLGQGLHEFRTLAVPLGFTPIEWLKLQTNVRIVEVPNAASALGLVLKQRVDGADVEYNVARHYLEQVGAPDTLVMDPSLPFSPVGFHLSSLKSPEIIEQLNQFLIKEEVKIQALKQKFRLVETLADLNARQAQRHSSLK